MTELKQNRYNLKQNMVMVADKPLVRQMNQHEAGILQQLAAGPVIQVEQALTAMEGADERTSGKDRSWALLIRLIPFSTVWLLGTIFIVWKMNLENIDGFAIFGILTAITYYKMDQAERFDSRHGVEHHKIASAVTLTERKLEYDYELKRMTIDATIKQLEARGNDY